MIFKYLRTALTPAEKAAENVAKRKRLADQRDTARQAGWRHIDKKVECFVLDELAPMDAFLSFKRIHAPRFIDIFQRFVTDELITKVMNRWSDKDLYLGDTTKAGSPKQLKPTKKLVWQTLAIQVRLIGLQNKSTENDPIKNPLNHFIKDCIEYFKDDDDKISLKSVEKMIHIMTFDGCEDMISKSFQEIVLKLGQSIAGDEKLFHFTGDSGDIRLVVSKPDRIGLWFYEVVAQLGNGSHYMLYVKLQTSRDGPVEVASIVQDWINIIKFTGSSEVIDVPNPKTMLVFDSYYHVEAGRQACIENRVKFSCSVRPDRMQAEKRLLQRADSETPGDEETIYREASNELFTYHYDRQKGVGKKFNLTHGLIRDTAARKVKENKDVIPGYDMYKAMFEVCDRYNRNLHDRHWPYKRGGKGRKGEWGHTHDFFIACILQNTFSAHSQIMKYDPKILSFKTKCVQLSDALYEYSCSL